MRSMLKQRLYEADMTQRQLAEAMGVSKDTVWRWTTEGGIGSMTIRRAVGIANVLGCEVSDLFSPDGGPRRG